MARRTGDGKGAAGRGDPAPAADRPSAPAADGGRPVDEPVWLVRAVLVMFLVGFAAFLAREVRGFLQSLP